MILEYGVGAKNKLDTFARTYTKDMITSPSITVSLYLTTEELRRIYKKMLEINFFDYPDKFVVHPPGDIIGIQTPFSSYYFIVEYNSKIKKLSWNNDIVYVDEKAGKLNELIRLITDIISSKEEYQKLPEPRGGYL
jgi:hypothetical protein